MCTAVEISLPHCPTWSHFIKDKLKISIYLSLKKVNTILYFIFYSYDELTCYVKNGVNPDQLASKEAS